MADAAAADEAGTVSGSERAGAAAPAPLATTGRRRSAASGLFRSLFDIALVPMILLVVVGRYGNQDWLFDLTNFFKPHIAALTLVLLVAAVLSGSRLRVAGSILVLAGALYPLVFSDLPVAAAVPKGNFRLMIANVDGFNRDYDAFARLVAEEQPDVLVLQEAGPEWRPALAGLEGLPYGTVDDLSTHVVVMSRYPIRVSAVPLDELSMPTDPIGGSPPLRVEIERPGGVRPLVLYGIHAPTTRMSIGWTVRENYIRAIKALAAAETATADVIVAGDWNTPYWSPRLRIFLGTDGRLRTTERGAWPPPTRFFREAGLPAALGTPIDRIVVSNRIGAASVRVGEDFGSDHVPVTADLAIP